ncbi:MAG: site-specific integrase [Calditrichaeota bacterium]|nr:MAG: site-specific integrase [Calditrichota bacterium]
MGIRKHPNSPFWHFKFTVNGTTVTGSTKTKNKTLARQIYAAKRTDFLRGKNDIPKIEKISLPELATLFLKWSQANKKSYARDRILVNHLIKFFGKRNCDDISSFDVERYKTYRIRKVSPSTVNREIACLSRMYTLGKSWQKVYTNPVKSVQKFKEPKKSFRWWSEDEIEKVLNACQTDYMKAIVLVGINTGMRIDEILNLQWNDIDFQEKYITIQESKNGEYRKVRMNAMAIDAINSMRKRGKYVFSHRNGKRIKRINRGFSNLVTRAKIAHSTPHVMRHTFASHLTMLGVDPHTIMELGGWKSLDMVLRYSHLAPEHKQHAVDGLANRYQNRISLADRKQDN